MARPLQGDWEAEGKVPDMPGYVFRARRMIRGMGHMLFPRYIQREARDFFYLTRARSSRDAPFPLAACGSGRRRGRRRRVATRGLPQHGFPYALATTWVRLDPAFGDHPRLRRARRPADDGPRSRGRSRRLDGPGAHGAVARIADALLGGPQFVVAPRSPAAGAVALVGGHPLDDPRSAGARPRWESRTTDGMLVWVELGEGAHPSAETAAAIDALLARMGCSARIGVPGDAHALLGGTTDAAGHPAPAGAAEVRLVRAAAPDAHPLFADTPVVPIQVWQPLQTKRVRYFYKPPPGRRRRLQSARRLLTRARTKLSNASQPALGCWQPRAHRALMRAAPYLGSARLHGNSRWAAHAGDSCHVTE